MNSEEITSNGKIENNTILLENKSFRLLKLYFPIKVFCPDREKRDKRVVAAKAKCGFVKCRKIPFWDVLPHSHGYFFHVDMYSLECETNEQAPCG